MQVPITTRGTHMSESRLLKPTVYPNLGTDAHSYKDAADAADAIASTDTRPADTHAACTRRQTALCP
eukprot:2351922-Pleurochrysis_carterae.AAC.1